MTPTTPTSSFPGYPFHGKDTLPIKAGDRLHILKGTPLRSMHPKKEGRYEARSTYWATCHHTLPGHTVRLGFEIREPNGSLRFVPNVRPKEVRAMALERGCDPSLLDHDGVITFLRKHPDSFREGEEVRFHRQPPVVCWPGAGGYWVQASVNDVEVTIEAP